MPAPHAIVVIPCFNESDRIRPSKFVKFAQEHPDVGLLFVDDGSRDGTAQIVERDVCCHVPDQLRMIALANNSGKAEAVRQGILHALAFAPAFVGYWDADLATPLEDICRFRQLLLDHRDQQIVIGARVQLLGRSIQRKPLRHVLGRCFATVASLVVQLPVYDTQCGAKLFRVTPETKSLFSEPFCTRWIFDVELLCRFLQEQKSRILPGRSQIYEMVLGQWHDVAGSKVRPHDFFVALVEIVRLYWRYRVNRRGAVHRPAPSVEPAWQQWLPASWRSRKRIASH